MVNLDVVAIAATKGIQPQFRPIDPSARRALEAIDAMHRELQHLRGEPGEVPQHECQNRRNAEVRRRRWRRALSALASQPPLGLAPSSDEHRRPRRRRLACAQKEKLAQCRDRGRRGWNNPLECSIERLAMLLGIAVSKG